MEEKKQHCHCCFDEDETVGEYSTRHYKPEDDDGEGWDSSGKITVMGAPVVSTTKYNRPYNPLRRPKVGYRNFSVALTVFVLSLAAVITLSNIFIKEYALAVSLAYAAVYILVISKKAVIWLVHLYQSKAADDTRLRCRFEPSCSEYMIKAVEKYGSVKGTLMGLKRLLRCRAPHGGIDYP